MKRSLFYGAATLRIDHVTEAGISRVYVVGVEGFRGVADSAKRA